MKGVKKYWNPIIETMPLERLFALQLRKLKRILRWAYDNSPFYRRLYEALKLELAIYDKVARSADAEKGIAAFLEKRAPTFKAR